VPRWTSAPEIALSKKAKRRNTTDDDPRVVVAVLDDTVEHADTRADHRSQAPGRASVEFRGGILRIRDFQDLSWGALLKISIGYVVFIGGPAALGTAIFIHVTNLMMKNPEKLNGVPWQILPSLVVGILAVAQNVRISKVTRLLSQLEAKTGAEEESPPRQEQG
jgi:hypothetical protein